MKAVVPRHSHDQVLLRFVGRRVEHFGLVPQRSTGALCPGVYHDGHLEEIFLILLILVFEDLHFRSFDLHIRRRQHELVDIQANNWFFKQSEKSS